MIDLIYKNVELHNVAELSYTKDSEGVNLLRFPQDVIDVLKDRSSFVSRTSTGCEVRFVSDARHLWVTMGAYVRDVHLTVFCGDIVYKKITIEQGKKSTFQLDANVPFSGLAEGVLEKYRQRFSHNVWRIYVDDEMSHCVFYDVTALDGFVRPPQKSEVPQKKWLAYGSSITHGAITCDTSISYIQHAARNLFVDVLGKGMSGSCFCEKEMANYFAREEWDFATLEIGANMYQSFKNKDFKKRAQYLIQTLHEEKPDNLIIVITPYPTISSLGNNQDLVSKRNDFVKILEELVENIHSDNVIIVSGNEIMDSISYLSADLVHPSEYGHVRMGENLADILKNLI